MKNIFLGLLPTTVFLAASSGILISTATAQLVGPMNAPPPVGIHAVGSAPLQSEKVVYLGPRGGLVAKALAASRPDGTGGDYDILVVGDVDKLGPAVLTVVQAALASGKAVVFDAPSDGSGRRTHDALLEELVGTVIDAPAVRVVKAPNGQKGYYVTPIDAPAAAARQVQAASQISTPAASRNSVANVFGIGGSVKQEEVTK